MARLTLTLEEARAAVRVRVGDLQSGMDTEVAFGNQRLNSLLNDACRAIVVNSCYRGLRELHEIYTFNFSTSDGLRFAQLPEDFARVRSLYVDTARATITNEDNERVHDTVHAYEAANARQPFYRIEGSNLIVYPITATAGRLYYIREHKRWVDSSPSDAQVTTPELDTAWYEALITFAVGKALASEQGAPNRLQIIQYTDSQFYREVQMANLAFGLMDGEPDRAATALDAIARMVSQGVTINGQS